MSSLSSGPGLIGEAIARRVGVGKHVLLPDVREENANAAAETFGNAGYVATVDASSREAVHALVETPTETHRRRGSHFPRRPTTSKSAVGAEFVGRRAC